MLPYNIWYHIYIYIYVCEVWKKLRYSDLVRLHGLNSNFFLVPQWLYIWPYMGQQTMRKQIIYIGKFKSYSWVGLLGQPSGLAGGRVGPGGRDICNWVNRYGADLTKNGLLIEKLSLWPILIISGPSRPQKWIRLEILRRIDPTRGLEVTK